MHKNETFELDAIDLQLLDWLQQNAAQSNKALAGRLQAAMTTFLLAPQVRFEGQPGEQWTMFFCDPCGNPIEMKGLRSLDTLYAA